MKLSGLQKKKFRICGKFVRKGQRKPNGTCCLFVLVCFFFPCLLCLRLVHHRHRLVGPLELRVTTRMSLPNRLRSLAKTEWLFPFRLLDLHVSRRPICVVERNIVAFIQVAEWNFHWSDVHFERFLRLRLRQGEETSERAAMLGRREVKQQQTLSNEWRRVCKCDHAPNRLLLQWSKALMNKNKKCNGWKKVEAAVNQTDLLINMAPPTSLCMQTGTRLSFPPNWILWPAARVCVSL